MRHIALLACLYVLCITQGAWAQSATSNATVTPAAAPTQPAAAPAAIPPVVLPADSTAPGPIPIRVSIPSLTAPTRIAVTEGQIRSSPAETKRFVSNLVARELKQRTAIINRVGKYDKLSTSMRWRDALKHCEGIGARLCSYREYCPNGPMKKPAGGMQSGPAWAPISDSNNDWVFIGNQHEALCKRHTELYGSEPKWGSEPEDQPFKGNVLCCGMVFEKLPTESPTWFQAATYCENKQRSSGRTRLCTRAEVCPFGKGKAPLGGALFQSHWTAVYDAVNEWTAIGVSFPTRMWCQKHGEISPDRQPQWGLAKEATPLPKRSLVMCCRDEFYHIAGRIVYPNAVAFCSLKGKRLCRKHEYCPKGKIRGGLRPGEAWAPIEDDVNEWIAVGQDNRDRSCQTYQSIMGEKPEWGATLESDGVLGHIQCCDIIWHNAGQRMTWSDAVAFCSSRKERLCRYDEICQNGPFKEPRGGPLPGKIWSPVIDRANEWVYASNETNKTDLMCRQYSELAGRGPEWGNTTGWPGFIQCCPNDGTIAPDFPLEVIQPVVPSRKSSANVTMEDKIAEAIRKEQAKALRPARRPTASPDDERPVTRRNDTDDEPPPVIPEFQQKLLNAEQMKKQMEAGYWKQESRNKKSGEHQFKEEYRKTVKEVTTRSANAAEEAQKILEEAQKGRIRHVKLSEKIIEPGPYIEPIAKSRGIDVKEKTVKIFASLPMSPREQDLRRSLSNGDEMDNFSPAELSAPLPSDYSGHDL